MERVCIEYGPNKTLPTHKAIITNQREKYVKALASAVYATNKANQNLNPSQKEIL